MTTNLNPKPSIGRIVHYVQYDDNRCVAAIITDVAETSVSLLAFSPDRGTHSQDECVHSDAGEHGTWHWPERV